MAQIGDVVFDCRHPAALARFWAGVLDGNQVAPYDDAEPARLRSLGIDGPEDDPTVVPRGPRRSSGRTTAQRAAHRPPRPGGQRVLPPQALR